MSYVWTPEKIARYRRYYSDIRTHHTFSYLQYATTEEFARSVLPPCLKPADKPKVTVSMLAFMEWVHGVPNRSGRDRAAIIGINAKYGDIEGEYYLTVIETEEVNIATGREFWGMPKKQGEIDFFEDGEKFYAFAGRKGHRLIEMSAHLGPAESVEAGDIKEFYFDLRGFGGVNAGPFTQPQLVIFENSTATKRFQPLTDPRLTLTGAPCDPGVGTIPVGEFIGGGHLGGETSYIVKEVVELAEDGNDYTPYLMGRLYDDWPDVRVQH